MCDTIVQLQHSSAPQWHGHCSFRYSHDSLYSGSAIHPVCLHLLIYFTRLILWWIFTRARTKTPAAHPQSQRKAPSPHFITAAGSETARWEQGRMPHDFLKVKWTKGRFHPSALNKLIYTFLQCHARQPTAYCDTSLAQNIALYNCMNRNIKYVLIDWDCAVLYSISTFSVERQITLNWELIVLFLVRTLCSF